MLLGALVLKLFADLRLELLDGDLGLEDLADALAPRLLEHEHLCADVLLPALPGGVDEVDVALDAGEVALDGAERLLEVVIRDEPGVCAVAVEEGEVLVAGGEVGGGDVGVGEDGAEVVVDVRGCDCGRGCGSRGG